MTLCRITPTTGRTHQIRVHAKYIGHPVVGDAMYSKTSSTQGQRLQAICLAFIHPKLQVNYRFQVPISSRMGI